jgi:hypothetical protein
MKSSIQNRLTIALMILCIGMLGTSGLLFWNYGMLKIRVAFASEQTRIFDEMRTKALQSTTAEAVGCLDYVVNYYPSGSKQETGSRLDRMVERERARAEQDIIAYLRTNSAEDLGTSPDGWIRKYGPK